MAERSEIAVTVSAMPADKPRRVGVAVTFRKSMTAIVRSSDGAWCPASAEPAEAACRMVQTPASVPPR